MDLPKTEGFSRPMKTEKIKGFLMAFLVFFFFHAFSRVTCHEKS